VAAPSPLTPAQRSARARLAAHARWARDAERTQIREAAQSSPGSVGYWLARVEAEHPELTEKARRKLAISKRNEHMARLAYNRERARRQGAVA
jgi:hypothetical protein